MLPLYAAGSVGHKSWKPNEGEAQLYEGPRGWKLLSLSCDPPAGLLFDWNFSAGTLAGPDDQRLLIERD